MKLSEKQADANSFMQSDTTIQKEQVPLLGGTATLQYDPQTQICRLRREYDHNATCEDDKLLGATMDAHQRFGELLIQRLKDDPVMRRCETSMSNSTVQIAAASDPNPFDVHTHEVFIHSVKPAMLDRLKKILEVINGQFSSLDGLHGWLSIEEYRRNNKNPYLDARLQPISEAVKSYLWNEHGIEMNSAQDSALTGAIKPAYLQVLDQSKASLRVPDNGDETRPHKPLITPKDSPVLPGMHTAKPHNPQLALRIDPITQAVAAYLKAEYGIKMDARQEVSLQDQLGRGYIEVRHAPLPSLAATGGGPRM